MIRSTLCIALLAVNLVAAAEIMRSASTHLTTYLAAAAADAAAPSYIR